MTKPLALLLCASLAACGGAPQPAPAEPAPVEPAPTEPARGAEAPPTGEDAELAKAHADLEAARRDRDEAIARIEQLERATADMIEQINRAIAMVEDAQSDADRAAAKAKLTELQRQQVEMQAQIKAAKDAAAKARRK